MRPDSGPYFDKSRLAWGWQGSGENPTGLEIVALSPIVFVIVEEGNVIFSVMVLYHEPNGSFEKIVRRVVCGRRSLIEDSFIAFFMDGDFIRNIFVVGQGLVAV